MLVDFLFTMTLLREYIERGPGGHRGGMSGPGAGGGGGGGEGPRRGEGGGELAAAADAGRRVEVRPGAPSGAVNWLNEHTVWSRVEP